jgi:hypothetical protein
MGFIKIRACVRLELSMSPIELKGWKNHAWNTVTKFIKIYLSAIQNLYSLKNHKFIKNLSSTRNFWFWTIGTKAFECNVWPTIAR